MYDREALRRKICKEGIERAIADLQQSKFDKEVMRQLEASNIFVNGSLNTPYIRSLAVM